MMSRFLLGVGLVALMLVGSFGTYSYLGGRQSKVAVAVQKPTAASPRPHAFILPGTLYLAQSGALYSLSLGRFHQITPETGWTQPSLYPDNSYLLAVFKTDVYSDVYVLNRFGGFVRRVTNNLASPANPDNSVRHWSLYPRLGPDMATMFMSLDSPKFGYDVPFSIWSLPISGATGGRLWTNANDYTGGDMQPIPLRSGGIIFTKYSYGPDGNLVGQIWLTTHPSPGPYGVDGRGLTAPADDCQQPSLSPDGTQIAMICTYELQISRLEIGSWDGSNITNRHYVIIDQLVAQPTWAPDGSGIAYLAPSAGEGAFQLWFLPKNAYNPPPPSPIPVPTPTPGGPYHGTLPSPTPTAPVVAPVIKPIQITTGDGFDATSPIAWAL